MERGGYDRPSTRRVKVAMCDCTFWHSVSYARSCQSLILQLLVHAGEPATAATAAAAKYKMSAWQNHTSQPTQSINYLTMYMCIRAHLMKLWSQPEMDG